MDEIIIKGARENNLKNVNLTLPKNKLIVMTGVSGSGKSSLASPPASSWRSVRRCARCGAPRVLRSSFLGRTV